MPAGGPFGPDAAAGGPRTPGPAAKRAPRVYTLDRTDEAATAASDA